MAFAKVVVRAHTLTGLERDIQTNTMHFDVGNQTVLAAAPTLTSTLDDFYAFIDQYMSDDIFDPDLEMLVFDMADPEPRVPVFRHVFGMTLGAAESLPLECSMVVSFAGPVVSGPGAGRKRGRIYLPTFTKDTITSGAGGIAWTGTVRSNVAANFAAMASSLLDLTPAQYLMVYSPTTQAGGASLAASMTTVTRGWVDSEPDTQRRRSHNEGVKVPFVVS